LALGPEIGRAEGIALGNPLAGGGGGLLFGLPLIGCALLVLFFLGAGLGRFLVKAAFICAAYIFVLFLIGVAGGSNSTAIIWLIGIAMTPWFCFVTLGISFIIALRRESLES
jgi:hypothetical protein